MTTQSDRLDALEAQMQTVLDRVSVVPGGQCSAERPHPNKLVFMRGPNHYACECGQLYAKDGKGGLQEVR